MPRRLRDLMDEWSDPDLVAAAQAGDLVAYETLVRRHQAFVTATVMRVVRNRATADDLAQEALFRAWRRLPDFRGDAQFRSWVYRIATNLALNHVERSREQPHEVLPESGRPTSAEGEAMGSALHEAWKHQADRLPRDLRDPYLLREEESLSYEEIAQRLEIPLNTVRTRIHRARRRMAESMKDWR